MTSNEKPPLDESAQWSGPTEGDSRDPMVLGDALKANPIAQEVGRQGAAIVRAAEKDLQALLDDPNSDPQAINAAREELERVRAQEEVTLPPA